VSLLEKLPKVRGEYKMNYQLAPITRFKVGGNADVLFKPQDVDDLSFFLQHLDPTIPVTTLGACSNVIIRDGGIEGVVVKLGGAFSSIEIIEEGILRVGASTLNYNTAQFCLRNSIAGFEFLIGIPGTAGGGVAMNAGAYGREFKDFVLEVEAVDRSGQIQKIQNAQMGFEYRSNKLPAGYIFTSVVCQFQRGGQSDIKKQMDCIVESREKTQPIKEKTCGSTFANPYGHKAWQLIEDIGMKGALIGDAQMSTMHANFMINIGNATAQDLESLGELVRVRVKERKDVELKWEVQRIGRYG
jgi:UDP-N-acetylmuramate dehydrogenase